MENGAQTAAAMEGVHASVAGLDALFRKDAALTTGAPGASAGTGVGGGIDVLQRAYELRLDRLGLLSKLEAQIAGLKARDAAEALDLQHAMTPPEAPVHERTYAEMSAIEEIAGVLTISSPAAAALVTQSRQLCTLPLAMAALFAGTISWQHARIIADETEALGPAGGTALTAHFLDPDAPNPARGAAAGDLVPSRFRAKVRTWRERHHPESFEKRHAKSAADRRVEHCPDRDGMAWISAYLPADTASAIWNRTNALARGKQGPDETRTLPQIRADELSTALLTAGPTIGAGAGENSAGTDGGSDDVIGMAALSSAGAVDADRSPDAEDPTGTSGHGDGTGDPGTVPTPRADVLVTVPVLALLGLTDEPAMLDGHGPIPASMARKLVADGAHSFYRVLVDPRDGAPLEIGRKSYRLPETVKRWLRMRDGKCTFPGCNNHTLDNETDHLLAWQHGGTTGISNLGQACRKHHRIKHTSTWTPTPATKNEPPGWTSPTGRHYKSEHPDWNPSLWPAGIGSKEPFDPPDVSGVDMSPLPARLDSAPPYVEQPYEEPEGNNLVDSDAFAPDDPVWDDFYAVPFVLPPDPQEKWALEPWTLDGSIPVLT